MQKFLTCLYTGCLLLCISAVSAQPQMKSLSELISAGDENWQKLKRSAERSRNKVEFLEKDSAKAVIALQQSQLSTGTTLGSIIYYSGGILIDDGWIRILGSGSRRLPRNIPEWNAGKISAMRTSEMFYILVADDVMGGLFAIKASSVEELENIGQVFYFGPNSLSWQNTGLSYNAFLFFCFNGNLNDFYSDFRWKGWKEEIATVDCNSVISCYPLLWTKEGLQMKNNRKQLAIQSQWNLYQGNSKSGSHKAVANTQKVKVIDKPVSMWTQELKKK